MLWQPTSESAGRRPLDHAPDSAFGPTDRAEAPRVLVVDDDPTVLRAMQRVLSAAGFEPVTAACARSAARCVARERPSAAVVDLMMPDMSGLELIRRWRTQPELGMQDVPVVVLTGRTDEEDHAAAEVLGVAAYMVKPPEADALVARLRAALQDRPASAFHSPLTGLPGAGALEEELQRRLNDPRPWAMLTVNITGMHGFNEQFGYRQGDLAILSLGAAMSSCLPAGSPLFHAGGDVFTAVVEPAAAVEIADDIRRAFEVFRVRLYEPAADGEGVAAGEVEPFASGRRQPPPAGCGPITMTAVSLTLRRARPDLAPRYLLGLVDEATAALKRNPDRWFVELALD
jgi:PleD family two-component response regulator